MPLAALQRETRTIPIVFAQVEDPITLGFVASISHPGGNITGFTQFEYSIGTQWVELLKQMVPNMTRVAVIYDADYLGAPGFLPMMDAAARAHALDISSYAVRSGAEIERAIDTFAREPTGGLIPLPGPLIAAERKQIISLTVKHRLPNLYGQRYLPQIGGLASYGPDNIDLYLRAADYIDRILRGETPADLPVQLPTKFQLVINLKTAKALGLEIPTTLLVRADEVIE